jgi:hypothetical protein
VTLFRRWHFCDLRPVAVEHRENPRVMLGPAPSTLVLYRCNCDRVESVEVPGTWTLAQVNGKREYAANEIAGE